MSGVSTPDAPMQVGMLLYPEHTALDFVGPHAVFTSVGMQVHLISDTLDPVISDVGLPAIPTTTLDDCPALDIICVPGGRVDEVMLDQAKVGFVAERGATAQYVTSVCTGSIVLAAAGLLDGYRAATHWSTRAQLAALGVEVSDERVCVDRNRFTGGGVTAGIDFGLTLVEHLFGAETAKFSQLALEYNPQPPLDAGSPEGAGPIAVKQFNDWASVLEKTLDRAVAVVGERRAAAAVRS